MIDEEGMDPKPDSKKDDEKSKGSTEYVSS